MILYTLLSRSGSRIVSLILGLLLLLVGASFLLRNAFGFDLQINWDLIWPVMVIITGLAVLSRAFEGLRSDDGPLTRRFRRTLQAGEPLSAEDRADMST